MRLTFLIIVIVQTVATNNRVIGNPVSSHPLYKCKGGLELVMVLVSHADDNLAQNELCIEIARTVD